MVITRIVFFHMYSQPTALRMDLFSSTSGIPPSSVPAGQISLQKYGAPWPMISTTNMGSRITNTRKITYFSFRRSLSPRNVRIFFGKGILFNRSWISLKGQSASDVEGVKRYVRHRRSGVVLQAKIRHELR